MQQWPRRDVLVASTAWAGTILTNGRANGESPAYKVGGGNGGVEIQSPQGAPLLRYVVDRPPKGEPQPSVDGYCYTHPLRTPSGEVVTDLAPKDHPHHRGIFCAWVKVEGEAVGDWWGWGALAPKDGRGIVNKALPSRGRKERFATIYARNAWMAGETRVLIELFVVTARQIGAATVADYNYLFVPPTEKPVTLARNPFGGFCYRARPLR